MRKTVVLIDDDPDDLDIMKESMTLVDPAIFCIDFIYPIEAIHKLSNHLILTPDYIFIDINMPLKPGPECLHDLRKIKALEKTLIVMYSTYLPKEISDRLISAGADFAFQKPVTVNAYLSILSNILGNNSITH